MDQSTQEFQDWLQKASTRLQEIIRSDPAKFKCLRRTPTFTSSIITQSRDPDLFCNELRCRLATKNDSEGNRVATSVILQNGEVIQPSRVWSNGFITPIFSMHYYKDGDDFGLGLTMLKAEYEPPAYTPTQHQDWIADTDAKEMGSVSSSSSGFVDGFVN